MNRSQDTTVFIVEDSPDVRDALVDLLETDTTVSVVGSAEDAATAIEAIARCHPKFVVLDYQLVGSTGVDVLRTLHPALPDTVFIVLTNHTTAQYRRICIDAGATWFLDKTRDFAKVRDIIAPQTATTQPPIQP